MILTKLNIDYIDYQVHEDIELNFPWEVIKAQSD